MIRFLPLPLKEVFVAVIANRTSGRKSVRNQELHWGSSEMGGQSKQSADDIDHFETMCPKVVSYLLISFVEK